MKKKIAVFANGWNSENLENFMNGVMKGLPPQSADLFMFLSYASYASNEVDRKSESCIYDLPNLKKYDGAIIFGAGLNFPEVIEDISKRCMDARIPVVSMGVKKPGFVYIGVDNFIGMKSLCSHIIEQHGVKSIKFVAGSAENEDSNARLTAVKTAMEEHGLKFDDKDVFYSNWETREATDYVEKLVKSDELPDALVCANDPLALAISIKLEELGKSAPEDVILTGFDYLFESQVFYPSIASVDQDFESMGAKAASMLMSLFNKEKIYTTWISPCRFIPGESCGCKNCRNEEELRHKALRMAYTTRVLNGYKRGRMDAMAFATLDSDKYSNLSEKLRNVFERSNGREGDTFYILMDPLFASLAYDSVDTLPKYSFNEQMDIITAKTNSKPVTDIDFDDDDLIPGYDESGDNHVYTFMPIYLQSFVCGYMVFRDLLEYFGDTTFEEFHKTFNNTLERYRQSLQVNALNSRLSELMQKDPLTGVRNRTAFEECKTNIDMSIMAGDCADYSVAMFDINNLKIVNDELGHEFGDVYIKNCCRFICESFKHSPVFRIGGDEFVALISNDDYLHREKLLSGFRKNMKDISADVPLIDRISIASGMSDLIQGKDCSIGDALTRADALMYENKVIMKNGNVR